MFIVSRKAESPSSGGLFVKHSYPGPFRNPG